MVVMNAAVSKKNPPTSDPYTINRSEPERATALSKNGNDAKQKEGALDKFRSKWPWFDHIMEMQERYTDKGGNQFAAGITYFSVLSIFPLLMLTMAIVAMVLAGNQGLMDRVTEQISNSASGEMGETLNTILAQAVDQRGSVFSVALLLALWTGLTWISHLRIGASAMWNVSGKPESFIGGKIKDLIGLVVLILSLIVAMVITVVGNSGITNRLLEALNLADVPGIFILTYLVSLALGLLANYLVFAWMLGYLPRTKVHRRSVAKAALIGAVLFEVFKQFATVFFANALGNPAGAAFGPIIGVMVLLYFIWRIMLYCSAWAATTPESLEQQSFDDAPGPAIIQVREAVAVPRKL